jgi:hypothetical protein
MVGRFPNLSKVLERSGVGDYNVVIINELNDLIPYEIKSITGNDPESVQKFYTQRYELQTCRALVYGATNVHVRFRNSTSEIDRTTISRLYSILFTGKSIPSTYNQCTFFSMMCTGTYYINKSFFYYQSKDVSAVALGWLAFSRYIKYRDNNYYPLLNVDSVGCRDYQNIVYYNNSKLYKFLVDAGLIDELDFFISKKHFLNIIRRNISKDDRAPFKDIETVRKLFQVQNNIDFDKMDVIRNYQEIGLIKNIYHNMAAIPDKGSIITKSDIAEHLKMYTSVEHVDNAYQYFSRTYKDYYDDDLRVYKDLMFKNKPVSYEGNESSMTDSTIHNLMMDSSSSLVLQNV